MRAILAMTTYNIIVLAKISSQKKFDHCSPGNFQSYNTLSINVPFVISMKYV